jgi:hypothetical protein
MKLEFANHAKSALLDQFLLLPLLRPGRQPVSIAATH